MNNTKKVSRNIKARSSQKPIKHKPKDKPKRSLSAYNYFFSDERRKIIKAIKYDDDAYRNEIVDHGLSKELITKLRDGSSKVKFEVIGKLIGSRWKNINDEKTIYYNSLAERDKKRYAIELEIYKQRKQSIRQEATSFTGNNYVYPKEQHVVLPYMQSRPSTIHEGHMGYVPSYSNGSSSGRMCTMATPNSFYMPAYPANYDHFGNNAYDYNARYANEVRYDPRDEYYSSTSSSQPGHCPSYPSHASRNEQHHYGCPNHVSIAHSNAYQVRYPSNPMSAFEQANFH